MTEPKAQRFVLQLHYEMFVSWWRALGQPPPPVEALPQSGFIVPDAAAGFLYRTDSCLAVVEGLIANPQLSGALRSQAIDLVTAALIDEAKRLGFKNLTASTTSSAVVTRAQSFGFSVLPGLYRVVARIL